MATTTVVVEMETLGGEGAVAYAEDMNSAERADALPPPLTRERETDSRMFTENEVRRRAGAAVVNGEDRSTSYAGDGDISGDEREAPSSTRESSTTGWFAQWLGFGETAEMKAYDKEHGYDKLKYDHVNNHPPGIPQLAYFQSSDDNFAVYRRFGWLSARLLATLEIELTELEQRLLDLDAEDGKDPMLVHRLWGRENFEGWNDAQKTTVESIRTKLGEYFELLLQESQVRALGQAPKRHYLGLFNFVWNEKPLAEEKMDFVFHAEDFVSASMHFEKGNRLGDAIEAYVDKNPQTRLKWFLQTKRELKKSTENVDHFAKGRLAIIVKSVTVCLAVALLLTPVLLLFLVSMSRGAMAAIVVGFVLSFAILISIISDAKVEQILIGTAAYGAVLVTFLGNLGGISNET